MRIISLTNGGGTGVDNEDFEYLNQWKWYNHRGYAERTEYSKSGAKKQIYLHRLVAKTPKGKITDHINHNTLDNRKSNLRVCTGAQNQFNQKKQKRVTSSRFKGVTLHKPTGLWHAQLRVDKKHVLQKYCKTEEEAANLYNKIATEYFGEFANLNIL